jgi:uncharacterized protein (TIGR03086 family)
MDVEMYERALARTGKIVSGTSRDQLGDPTPCTDWDVRTLLNHMIDDCLTYAAGVADENRESSGSTDHCAEDHVTAFDHAAQRAVEAFGKPGALEREHAFAWGDTPGSVALGLALTEAVVHGWDLATATRQEVAIDEDIAEELYGMTSSMMAPKGSYPRGSAFEEPIEIAEDAPAADRLLAYLGRRP